MLWLNIRAATVSIKIDRNLKLFFLGGGGGGGEMASKRRGTPDRAIILKATGAE